MDDLDGLFCRAVAAIDGGDVGELERLLAAHPRLLRERLTEPGEWLRRKVGGAVDDFFRAPYLLWFVAEDPVRNDTLPPNIVELARTIVDTARRAGVASLQEQLDYALSLVSWSWVARHCGVQIALIDVLLDAGAEVDRNPENALVNSNFEAAEHLLARGAPLRFASALILGRWDDAKRLAPAASAGEKQFALVLAALKGRVEALRRVLGMGVELDRPSQALYSHGRPVHHAVSSGSLEAVEILVGAGAALNVEDTLWHATPLGWAEYGQRTAKSPEKAAQYAAIAGYLRGQEGRTAGRG